MFFRIANFFFHYMKFLDKKYTKETMILALPVMLTQVGQVSVNLFDNIIVGKLLGANALASVSLGNALFISAFIFAMGFSLAIPPLVSEAHSQKNHEEINSVFQHGFVINMLVGLVMMLLLLLIIPFIDHLGQPPEIIPDTIAYLSIMAFSMLPFMAFQTFREGSEGLGYTIGVTKATIAGNILNVVLNYILIKGLFGFPAMGIQGSAIATLIARLFMFVLLYFILRKQPVTRPYIEAFKLKFSEFKKSQFVKQIRLGFPTAMQLFFEVTAFGAAAFVCGLVSATDVAAHQIALSMASFTFNLCVGFSVSATIMIGRKKGERNFVELRRVGINNLKLAFLFMSLCGLVFIVFRHILPTFFTKTEDFDVVILASKLLIIAALFQLSDGIQVTALGILRGMQDVKIPSILTFIAYWLITLPLGYFLTVILKMGSFGMWIALGLGLSISAVLLVRRFLLLTKNLIVNTQKQ